MRALPPPLGPLLTSPHRRQPDQWRRHVSLALLRPLSFAHANAFPSFLSADENNDAKLAYVDSSTGRAIIKVDNTTNVPYNEKRNTIRIASEERYDIGSVFVADFYHVPYGVRLYFLTSYPSPTFPCTVHPS